MDSLKSGKWCKRGKSPRGGGPRSADTRPLSPKLKKSTKTSLPKLKNRKTSPLNKKRRKPSSRVGIVQTRQMKPIDRNDSPSPLSLEKTETVQTPQIEEAPKSFVVKRKPAPILTKDEIEAIQAKTAALLKSPTKSPCGSAPATPAVPRPDMGKRSLSEQTVRQTPKSILAEAYAKVVQFWKDDRTAS